jgi:hypothetical protein
MSLTDSVDKVLEMLQSVGISVSQFILVLLSSKNTVLIQPRGVHLVNFKHRLLPAPTTQLVSRVHISATLAKTSLLLESSPESLHSDCKTQQNHSIP